MPYSVYQAYPGYNPMFYQQPLQNMQQLNQANNNSQIQNGGFVIVKDINEAMSYPVAPGNSVTFKNENQPYIYTKTVGFSQLDQPIFEVFKLTKEEPIGEVVQDVPPIEYMTLEDGGKIKVEMEELRSKIDFLSEYVETLGKEDKKENDKHKSPV